MEWKCLAHEYSLLCKEDARYNLAIVCSHSCEILNLF